MVSGDAWGGTIMTSKALRIPPGVWDWRGTAIVLVVVGAPPLVTIQLSPTTETWGSVASTVGLVAYPVAMAAALLLYFHWRLVDGRGTAWLVAALTAVSLKGIATAGMRASYAEEIRANATSLMLVDLAFAAGVLAMLALFAQRQRPPFDPMAMGLLIGLFVISAEFALLTNPPFLDRSFSAVTLGNVLLLTIQLTAAYAVLHISTLPPWARARLGVALGLLSLNRAITYPVAGSAVVSATAIVTDFLGAVLVFGTALALLRTTINDNAEAVDELHQRVEHFEAESRNDRARLHEINATIAGIASATRLIHRGPDLPSHRRGLLQEMLDSEISRLERLMEAKGQQLRDVELDDVIRPLVVAQHALGRPVFWTPSGQWAHGRADDIAEVVNVLLNNAARHAPGAAVVVNTRRVGDCVEIRVSDSGPGISKEMTARLFEWEAHSPESPGEGIGLHVARRLMEEQGGSLRPVLSHASGAVFVVGLQPPRDIHESANARAE